jgi:hypothetical protein
MFSTRSCHRVPASSFTNGLGSHGRSRLRSHSKKCSAASMTAESRAIAKAGSTRRQAAGRSVG